MRSAGSRWEDPCSPHRERAAFLARELILSVLPETDQACVPREAVTARSLIAGSVLVVLSDLYINLAVLVLHASKLNKSYYPMGLFFLFTVLVMVNLWRSRRGGAHLSSS